jgi:ABC-type Zn2+ transport system substrate-binding protein/surface adhesin
VDDSILDDDQELEQFARRFGTMFKGMDPEKRQRMMNAFLQGEQNIDTNPDNDTIETDDVDDIELLSDEDRELLDHDVEDQQDENDHVSDSKHARSTDDNDPDNSEGHQSGGAVSAN